MKNKIIEVQNVHISISKQELDDYICITAIAKAKSEAISTSKAYTDEAISKAHTVTEF